MGARHLILTALLAATAASAKAPADSVLRQLRAQGYVEFAVSRTLLGRLRILATAPHGASREVVLNPATGEVLRDILLADTEGAAPWLLGWAAEDPAGLEPDDDPPPRAEEDEDGSEDDGPPPEADEDPPPRDDPEEPDDGPPPSAED